MVRTDAVEAAADVVVVGARCAGASTAMLLARLGHHVVLVDRTAFPSDTVSTHGFSRSGVVQLDRWGLLDRVLESGAPAIREVSFHLRGETVVRTLKRRAGVDLLVAPRRHVLDAILVDAAAEAGVDVRTGVTVTGVTRDPDGRIDGITATGVGGRPIRLAARFVVGADGLRSRIARAVRAPIVDQRHSDGSAWYAYFSDLAVRGSEFHLADHLYAGLVPTHGGEANVWICGTADDIGGLPAREGRVDAYLELVERASPQLAHRLRRATRMSPVRGFRGMPNQLRHPVGPGWALVGDAGYHRDAVAAHGMSDAFRDAELLACNLDRWLRGELAERDALARYHRTRDRMVAEVFDLTVRLAAYPSIDEFVELQKRLGAAIEAESEAIAAWPPAPRATAVVAA